MPECNVCHNKCNLKNGDIGLCRARKNENGVIKSINYGVVKTAARHLDNVFVGNV